MSTNAYIGLRQENGTILSVYNHWDGYIEHLGVILNEHYRSREKIEELLSFGDLSSTRKNIHPNPDMKHSFMEPQDDVCVFYGRDRGEKHTEAKIRDEEALKGIEYAYIYEPSLGDFTVYENGEIKIEKLSTIINNINLNKIKDVEIEDAFIGYRLKSGEILSTYTDWSGYPEYLGVMLNRYYKSKLKMGELLSLGDAALISKKLHPDLNAEEKHTLEFPQCDTCLFYGRDGGKKDVGPKVRSKEELFKAKFIYIYEPDLNDYTVYESMKIKEDKLSTIVKGL